MRPSRSDATLCFFTSPSASAQGLSNTQLLSPRAQRKYATLGDATAAAEDAFNEATRALWWDGAAAYAGTDADTRPHSQREAGIKVESVDELVDKLRNEAKVIS